MILIQAHPVGIRRQRRFRYDCQNDTIMVYSYRPNVKIADSAMPISLDCLTHGINYLCGSLMLLSRLHQHPDGHGHHHEIFGQGDEAERYTAIAAHTCTLKITFLDVNGLENRNRTDAAS